MSLSYDFTLDRAQKSRDVQQSIAAKWLWEERTVAGWDADIAGLETQNAACSAAVAVMKAKRAEFDTVLDDLDARTGEALALMRVKLRNDPEKLASIETLTADGTGRAKKLEEALDWEAAWNKIDNTWAPAPANTFATYKTLRLQGLQLQKEYADEEVKVSAANKKLTLLRNDLEDTNQAWYKAATRVFAIGTSEGDLIRSDVPTTGGSAPAAAKPTPPAPAAPAK